MTISEPGGQSSSPKPSPRPGPPRPAPRPGRPAPTVAAPPSSDPHRFGRVDPDGTVWLITASGEREHRLLAGGRHRGRVRALRPPLRRPAHRGRADGAPAGVRDRRRPQDQGGGRRARRDAADAPRARRRRRARRAAGGHRRARRRQPRRRTGPSATSTGPRRPRARKRSPPRPRSSPTNSTQWKAAGDRLREILEEWRTITGLDRKTDDALWKRYSAARETFNRRRGSHFAELDRERAGARQAKEALCERAEELADSTDWGATGAAFRDLLTEWKAAGRAAKDVDDALWQRFKARPGHVLHGPQRRQRRARRRVPTRTPTPRRRCSPRRRRSTPAISTPPAPRCGRSATSGTRSARCRASAAPSWSVGCAPSRRRCATPPTGGVGPGGAGPGRPIPRSRRAIRAAGREGRGRRADQGRRRGTRQRRTVAPVGRRGGRGAGQALDLLPR